jgi:hypothetical protein
MYRQFKFQQSYVLPTQCIYVFCVAFRKKKQRLFPYTALTDWFYNREEVCLLRGTDWMFLYIYIYSPGFLTDSSLPSVSHSTFQAPHITVNSRTPVSLRLSTSQPLAATQKANWPSSFGCTRTTVAALQLL